MKGRLIRSIVIAALLAAVPGPQFFPALAGTIVEAPLQGLSAPNVVLGAAAGSVVGLPAALSNLSLELGGELLPSEIAPRPDSGGLTVSPSAAAVEAAIEQSPRPELGRLRPSQELGAGSSPADAPASVSRIRPLSPFLNAADPRSQEAAPTAAFLDRPERLSLPEYSAANASAGVLRGAAAEQMDRIFLLPSAARSAADSVPSGSAFGGPRAHIPGWLEEGFGPFLAAPGADKTQQAAQEFEPPAPQAPRGLARKGLDWFKGLFKVIPDRERNRSFWKYMAGQTLLSLGLEFHYSALGGMVAGKEQGSPRITYNRSVNWSAQAASTLTMGPVLDRSRIQRTLVWTYLGRGLLLAPVPILFIYGYYSFAIFQVLMFATSFLQSMSGTASSMAFNRILDKDKGSYDKANAILTVMPNIASVIGPFLAVSFIARMDALFGREFIGNALSYGVYAIFLISLAALFWTLKVPHDDIMSARKELAKTLKNKGGSDRRVRGVSAELLNGSPTLLVQILGNTDEVAGIPETFSGYEVKKVSTMGPIKEMMEGFRLNWKNRFLKRTLLLSTLDAMAGDAMIFAALAIYIKGVLEHGAALAPWLAGIPILGSFLEGLATPVGAFGLFRSALAMGMLIPAVVIALRPSRPISDEPKPEPGGLDRLEKRARLSSIIYGVGSIAFGAALFVPNLWIAAALMLLSALLQGPAQVVWGSVHQKVMTENFPDSMGKVFSARNFYYILCYIAGLLLFGGLITWLSPVAVLWAAGIIQVLLALKHIAEPYLVFPLERAPSSKEAPGASQ